MQEFTVDINGVDHTIQAQDADDAARFGYHPKEKARAAQNKAVKPQNKEAAASDDSGSARPAG